MLVDKKLRNQSSLNFQSQGCRLKLTVTDNAEHFLSTFKRIATQQKFPEEAWVTQLARLLTGKAYTAFTFEDALLYGKVKEAILMSY